MHLFLGFHEFSKFNMHCRFQQGSPDTEADTDKDIYSVQGCLSCNNQFGNITWKQKST